MSQASREGPEELGIFVPKRNRLTVTSDALFKSGTICKRFPFSSYQSPRDRSMSSRTLSQATSWIHARMGPSGMPGSTTTLSPLTSPNKRRVSGRLPSGRSRDTARGWPVKMGLLRVIAIDARFRRVEVPHPIPSVTNGVYCRLTLHSPKEPNLLNHRQNWRSTYTRMSDFFTKTAVPGLLADFKSRQHDLLAQRVI